MVIHAGGVRVDIETGIEEAVLEYMDGFFDNLLRETPIDTGLLFRSTVPIAFEIEFRVPYAPFVKPRGELGGTLISGYQPRAYERTNNAFLNNNKLGNIIARRIFR